MKVRFAKAEDAAQVQSLVQLSGHSMPPDLDWTKLFPFWLVAEGLEGRILGCMQLVPSLPVGFFEFLSFDPRLGFLQKGRVLKSLETIGEAWLKKAGVQYLGVHIQPQAKSWAQVLRSRGFVSQGMTALYSRRL